MDRTPPRITDASSADLGGPIEDTARSVLDVIDAAGSPGGDRSTGHSRLAPPRTRRRRQRFTAEQRGWIETWMTESSVESKEARRTLAENLAVVRRTIAELGAVHPLELGDKQARLLAAAVKVEVVVLSKLGLDALKKKSRRQNMWGDLSPEAGAPTPETGSAAKDD